MERVIRYKACDGQFFWTEKECLEHEMQITDKAERDFCLSVISNAMSSIALERVALKSAEQAVMKNKMEIKGIVVHRKDMKKWDYLRSLAKAYTLYAHNLEWRDRSIEDLRRYKKIMKESLTKLKAIPKH